MDTIETDVRQAVGSYFANITLRVFAENPHLLERLRDSMMTELHQSLDGLLESGKITEDTSCEIISTCRTVVSAHYTLDKRVKQVAEPWAFSFQCYKAPYEELLAPNVTSSYGIDEDLANSMREGYRSVMSHSLKIDAVIRTLVARANEEGFEAATTDDAIRSAVVQEFPTKDTYVTLVGNYVDGMRKLVYPALSFAARSRDTTMPELVLHSFATRLFEELEHVCVPAEAQVLYDSKKYHH